MTVRREPTWLDNGIDYLVNLISNFFSALVLNTRFEYWLLNPEGQVATFFCATFMVVAVWLLICTHDIQREQRSLRLANRAPAFKLPESFLRQDQTGKIKPGGFGSRFGAESWAPSTRLDRTSGGLFGSRSSGPSAQSSHSDHPSGGLFGSRPGTASWTMDHPPGGLFGSRSDSSSWATSTNVDQPSGGLSSSQQRTNKFLQNAFGLSFETLQKDGILTKEAMEKIRRNMSEKFPDRYEEVDKTE